MGGTVWSAGGEQYAQVTTISGGQVAGSLQPGFRVPDLVAEHLAVAGGSPVRLGEEGVVRSGQAVGCRIDAEDSTHCFSWRLER